MNAAVEFSIALNIHPTSSHSWSFGGFADEAEPAGDPPRGVPCRGIEFSGEAVRHVGEARRRPSSMNLRRRGTRIRKSWHVDETYIKVNGRWCYLYRAIDRSGALVDVRLSEKRDMAVAKAFFRSAKAVTGVTPARVMTDGHDSYPRAIRTELDAGVKHRTTQYLNKLESNRTIVGSCGRYMDRMRSASKVTSPHRASVDVSTNSVTTCKPVPASAETFQPTPAAIAF